MNRWRAKGFGFIVSLILAAVILGAVIWTLPRFVGAFYLHAFLRELDKASQQPRIRSDSIPRALAYGAMATRWDAANDQAVWRKIAALESDHPVYAGGIHIELAGSHSQEGEWEKALEEYRIAMTLAAGYMDDQAYADYDRALAGFYNVAIQRDPTNGRFHYLLAKYLDRIGERDEAIAEFRWVVNHAPDPVVPDSQEGEAYYRLGLYREGEGEIGKAMESYEKALWLNERLIDAYARLAQWYRENDRVAEEEELEARLASLQPEYEVGEEVSEGWILLGYDLDEEALEIGASIDMALYWLPLKHVKVEEPGWYQAGERWIQIARVKSLAPNGGFEWDETTGKLLPKGWPWRVYGAPLDNHELVIDQRSGKRTTCAKLTSSKEHPNTSFSTRDVPVEPDGVYLQAGWMRSEEGGKGYLGRSWYGSGKRLSYGYVAAGVGVSSWTHFAGLVRPVEGAEHCHLWLLNYNSEGKVYFDDVLFFELDIPD